MLRGQFRSTERKKGFARLRNRSDGGVVHQMSDCICAQLRKSSKGCMCLPVIPRLLLTLVTRIPWRYRTVENEADVQNERPCQNLFLTFHTENMLIRLSRSSDPHMTDTQTTTWLARPPDFEGSFVNRQHRYACYSCE